MDPLAHTLVGAALAETRLRSLTPLAAPTLILAANLPDIDVVSYAWGEHTALAFRRGWTHGVLALVVLPLALTALMVVWAKVWRNSGGRQKTVEDVGAQGEPGGEPPGTAPTRERRGTERGNTESSRIRPLSVLALATLGVATHPTLDWLNTYGMRWLMPFNGRWFYGDTLFIVDPWLWLLLGGAVFLTRSRSLSSIAGWALLATLATMLLFSWVFVPPLAKAVWAVGMVALGLVRVGRGPLTPGRTTRRLASVALALSLAYIGSMNLAGRLSARAVGRRLTLGGAGSISRVMSGPLPADPLGRDVVAETPGGYWSGTFRWRRTPPLIAGRPPIPRGPDDAVIAAAATTPAARDFLGWARFPFVEVDTTLRGFTVYFLDARYTRTRTRGFGSTVVDLDRDLSSVGSASHGPRERGTD